MSFCVKDKQLLTEAHTVVDNSFLINYIPDAPAIATKVYLLGLALAHNSYNNTIEDIANKLDLTNEDIIDAFRYWEEMGLVFITPTTPPQVVYLETRRSASMFKKIKPSKYSKFSQQIQNIISGRMITPSEYNEYYLFLENNLFQPEALLAIAQYCVDLKGGNISYNYILTVAHNLNKQGATTLETVADKFSSTQKYDQDLKLIYKAIGYHGSTEHEHREMMDKWISRMGYTLDTVIAVAKQTKHASMTRLNNAIEEYYSKGAMSLSEIDNYKTIKNDLLDTAKIVTRNIGLYYQSLDIVVDEYVSRWSRLGFDQTTLELLSKYCFKNNIRALSGLDGVIDKLYKLGYTTTTSINSYIEAVAASDKAIKQLLNNICLERNVTASDRQLYKTWTTDWSMPPELIAFAATKCIGASNSMQYLSKILSNYKANNISTLEEAQAMVLTTTTTAKPDKANYQQHEYTDQEINALFTDLDNIKL